MAKFNPYMRRKARYLITQALYQWHVAKSTTLELEQHFHDAATQKNVDSAYFKELIIAIPRQHQIIDELLTPSLSRPLAEVSPVELAILRLATYELKEHLEIPYRVVINEALELTKVFGTDDAPKFINGVLDKVAREIRKMEIHVEKNNRE